MKITIKNNPFDLQWMKTALLLARKGIPRTSPNPPVGAVVVKNGMLVGSGWHHAAGLPHAEVLAIKKAGKSCTGATLYVTLEPCSTWGRTPPCVDLIIQKHIRKVIIGCRDPNPLHDGKGIKLLRKAGIEVYENVCHNEAEELILPFTKKILTGLPYVTLKMAMSIDGRIADRLGHSKWITTEKSRRMVKTIRNYVDCIIIGGKTALIDNPSLTSLNPKWQPFRVVLTSQLLPLTYNLMQDQVAEKTIIASSVMFDKNKVRKIQDRGIKIWYFEPQNGRLPLVVLLQKLSEIGCLHVLIEGGSCLAGSFIKEKLVDRFLFFLAPIIIGEKGKSVVNKFDVLLRDAYHLKFCKIFNIGGDILIGALPLPPPDSSFFRNIFYNIDLSYMESK